MFNRTVLIEKGLPRFERTRIKLNLILVLVRKKKYIARLTMFIIQSTFHVLMLYSLFTLFTVTVKQLESF